MHIRMTTISVICAAIAAFGIPKAAFAHAFGIQYTLPVPLWMYTYGAAAALVLSFVVIGYVWDAQKEGPIRTLNITATLIIRFFRSPLVTAIAQALGVFLLILTIAVGFAGNQSPYNNASMALFWIVFLLGMTYASALFGDIWRTFNPWHSLCRWYGRKNPQGKITYPQQLGIYPALAIYVALIWFELIAGAPPMTLAIALSAYSAYVLAGAWVFGRAAWFAHAEFFTVFFGIIAKISPLVIEEGSVRLRAPFSGLMDCAALHASELWFIIFMIASTSFDGFQETIIMLRMYLQVDAFISYDVFRTILLLIAPLLFLGLYIFAIWLARRSVINNQSLWQLARAYAYTLVPIALAYNAAHYYTLLVVQGQDIFRLASDPLGFGWDLFGTAGYAINIGIVQAGFVWHSEVVILLVGHIASVYLAHVVTVRLFPSRRQALLAELPMLILMVSLTVIGLWLLSQPIA